MRTGTKFVVITALFFGTFYSISPDAEAATLRSSAMASAKTQKGAKYVWGREGGYSRGYDCSGLTRWAYRQHGKTIPRTAQAQYNKSRHVSPKNRRAGDLIFIRDARGHVYHVGIFTGVRGGKGYMINANYGKTTKHIVGEFPVKNYTAGSSYASYGEY